jgi:hypothetical protein
MFHTSNLIFQNEISLLELSYNLLKVLQFNVNSKPSLNLQQGYFDCIKYSIIKFMMKPLHFKAFKTI